jgi:bifunctional DNase/RNase
MATAMIEVFVVGLGIAPESSSPLLLLKEREGDRVLPIGIGQLEAHAIAMPLQGVRPPRPMTHDVFADVIADLGGRLRRVEITELTDNTFHACLTVDQAGSEHSIDIRPSDAVALAVRTETPIYVGEAVFDQAGIVPTEISEASDEPEAAEPKTALDESKLSPFKDFIDTLDIDDFGPAGDTRA